MSSQVVWASGPIVLRSPDVDVVTFRGVRRSYSQADQWLEWNLYGNEYQRAVAVVQQRLVEAQSAFLNNSPDVAKDLFIKLSDDRFNMSWKPETRSVFVYAMMRVAQLSFPHESDPWIERAINFDPGSEVSPQLFPPPLMTRYNEVNRQLESKRENVSVALNDYDTAIIDGRIQRFRANSPLTVSAGLHRIEFYSSSHSPVLFIGSTDELRKWSPQSGIQLIGGSCANPKFFDNALTRQRTVIAIYPYDCHRRWENGRLQPLPSNELPVFNLKNASVNSADTNASSLISLYTEEPPKRWYQNGWVWGAGGALVVGAIVYAIAASSQSGRGSQTIVERPVHR